MTEVFTTHDAAAALSSPALLVPTVEPVGAATSLQARMARFTNGPAHARRRAQVLSVLTRLDTQVVRRKARDQSLGRLPAQAGPVEVMALLAWQVPTAVLCDCLGVPETVEVQRLVRELCASLAPRSTPDPGADGDLAASRLQALLGSDDETVATLSVLFQAHDATAALIAASVLVGTGASQTADDSVFDALRVTPPVRSTRRVATADVTVGDLRLRQGDQVVVDLSTAPFGQGPHACPGQGLAAALAAGVVQALRDRQFRLTTQQVEYEPRPNLSLPVRLEGEVS